MIPAAVNQTDIKMEMSWASLRRKVSKDLNFNEKDTIELLFKIQSYVKCLERLDIVSMVCKAEGDTNLSCIDVR
jgi:hypothetical protein